MKSSLSLVHSICTIGIAGYSGSGKTTLIRKILPELKRRGFAVGVFKHIHHKLHIDTKGKDTDLFYRAGADYVFAHDDEQGFARYRDSDKPLFDLIRRIPPALDLIIMEGHKESDIPGIWIESGRRAVAADAPDRGSRTVVFRDDPSHLGQVLACIEAALVTFHANRTVMAGLLIGGRSSRMGRPKGLLQMKAGTLAERSFSTLVAVADEVVLLGAGQLPPSLDAADRLPDVPGVHGPLAGILSAFRWAPASTWIISSVDMPLMQKEAWTWLLKQRTPGVWAVLPRIPGCKGVETTGAVYEPSLFDHMETLAGNGSGRLQDLARHPRVATPLIPESLVPAWTNVNTPEEWKAISRRNSFDSS